MDRYRGRKGQARPPRAWGTPPGGSPDKGGGNRSNVTLLYKPAQLTGLAFFSESQTVLKRQKSISFWGGLFCCLRSVIAGSPGSRVYQKAPGTRAAAAVATHVLNQVFSSKAEKLAVDGRGRC